MRDKRSYHNSTYFGVLNVKEMVYEEVGGLDRLVLDSTMKKEEVLLGDFVISLLFGKDGIDNGFMEDEESQCVEAFGSGVGSSEFGCASYFSLKFLNVHCGACKRG